MSKQRKIIREKLVSLLKIARTKAGNNVAFQSDLPQDAKQLPFINLFAENEAVELDSTSPRVYKRTLKLTVEIISMQRTEALVLDELDDIGSEVEEVLCGFPDAPLNFVGIDPITGDKCYVLSDIQPTDVNYDLDHEAEKPTGSLRISFDVEYFEQLPVVGSPVDKFLTAALDWRQDGVAAADGPNDTVAIPQ